ncbi:MAG: Phage tail length tape-measure protein [Labilithrix sp.]|nr:Phage tail length tape-measure protein [Labilithrix sp.]
MAVRETKWVVTVDGNAKEASAETVDALKAMAAEYEKNKQALAQLNSALKSSGKGTAEVTKGIKDQIEKLTARQAVVTADAAKHGQSVKTIIKNAQKEAAEREKSAKKVQQAEKDRAATQAKAYSMLGGRLGALRNRLLEYKDVASEDGGKGALLKAGLTGAAEGAVALSAAAAAAAVAVGVALAVGIAAATVSLTKWVVLTASARAQTRLQMEAWVRTGENARNLADQVDALANKVPTSTEALSKLAIQLRQAGIRGAPLVDSLNAVGQASAALGDDAGAKIQEFITRYQRMGVMQINPLEMIGTGLDFDDVAGALAKGMGTSIEKARAALATGQVKLADGAAAMRKAVEDKFSGLNLRKLSDLSTLSEQFGKRLSALTKDVNLEPITRFLDRIYKSLDESSVSGQALKTLFESLATALGSTLDKNGDWIEYGLKESIIVALDLATQMVLVKNRVEDAFNDGRSAAEKFNSVLDTIKSGLKMAAGLSVMVFDPVHGAKWTSDGAKGLYDAATRPAGPGATKPVAPAALPAHASGGVVTGISRGVANTAPLPAAGEGLVSIGMGEAIVPASQVGAAGGGRAALTISIGDVIVSSSASDPGAVAKEVHDSVLEKILNALEIGNAQLAVR